MNATAIKTADELAEHLQTLLASATIESSFDRDFEEHDDLGGWVNQDATLADGSTLALGWWVHTQPDHLDATTADQVRRSGWAITPYGPSDVEQGANSFSAELHEVLERLADEDGEVEWNVELWDVTIEGDRDLLLLVMALAGDRPGREDAVEAWEAWMRGEIGRRLDDADTHELLEALRAVH